MWPYSYACIFFFQVVLWLRDLLSLYSQKVLRGIIIKCEKVTTILVITSKLNPKNFAFPFMGTCTMLWPCTTPGNSDYLSLFSSHPFFMFLNWLWKASVINPFSIWSLFIIRMLVVSTVLDKISGKPRPPPPPNQNRKIVRSGPSHSFILDLGGFSLLFYLIQCKIWSCKELM